MRETIKSVINYFRSSEYVDYEEYLGLLTNNVDTRFDKVVSCQTYKD